MLSEQWPSCSATASRTPVPDPMTLAIRDGLPLAPLTTLGVGGTARHYLSAEYAEARRRRRALGLRARSAPADPGRRQQPGGGRRGLPRSGPAPGHPRHRDRRRAMASCGRADGRGGRALGRRGRPGRGASWAGLECLSGIPGPVGATPIQNVGAYGQEVAETMSGRGPRSRHPPRVVSPPARAGSPTATAASSEAIVIVMCC